MIIISQMSISRFKLPTKEFLIRKIRKSIFNHLDVSIDLCSSCLRDLQALSCAYTIINSQLKDTQILESSLICPYFG